MLQHEFWMNVDIQITADALEASILHVPTRALSPAPHILLAPWVPRLGLPPSSSSLTPAPQATPNPQNILLGLLQWILALATPAPSAEPRGPGC